MSKMQPPDDGVKEVFPNIFMDAWARREWEEAQERRKESRRRFCSGEGMLAPRVTTIQAYGLGSISDADIAAVAEAEGWQVRDVRRVVAALMKKVGAV